MQSAITELCFPLPNEQKVGLELLARGTWSTLLPQSPWPHAPSMVLQALVPLVGAYLKTSVPESCGLSHSHPTPEQDGPWKTAFVR